MDLPGVRVTDGALFGRVARSNRAGPIAGRAGCVWIGGLEEEEHRGLRWFETH